MNLNADATHILIVDDDQDIRSLLADFLESNGLRTFQAGDGDEMRALLRQQPIDLLVLDLNLPGTSGLDLCREIRTESSLPIIMLTAKTLPIDRVVGLEIGADDYVCKPFEPLELLSRIRTVLRRVRAVPADENHVHVHEPVRMLFAGWTLDLTARHLVDPQGVIVSLSGMEFRLLRLFLERPNRILSRDQLMDMIHGRDAGPFDRSIDLQISRIRQKIEADSRTPQLIKTVRNEGYVLASTVKVETA